MGIRKDLIALKEERKAEKEGLIEENVRIGNETWRIIGVYVKENIEEYLKTMEKWMEEKKEDKKIVIGRDFNARTGEEGGSMRRKEDYSSEAVGVLKGRCSKDMKINREGRKLIKKIEEIGWSI